MSVTQVKLSKPIRNLTISLLNFVMAGIFAIVLAYWVWEIFKPNQIDPEVLMSPTPQTLLPSILSGHWFGEASNSAHQVVEQLDANVKLVGVLSASKHQPGFAIFRLEDGKQVYVMLNQEVTSGVKLLEISKNSVMIQQSDKNKTIWLEDSTDKTKNIVSVSESTRIKELMVQAESNKTKSVEVPSSTVVLDAAQAPAENPKNQVKEEKPFNIQELLKAEKH